MKKLLFVFLSLLLLVGCSSDKEEPTQCLTYSYLSEYSDRGYIEIKRDSMVTDTIINFVIKDGLLCPPNGFDSCGVSVKMPNSTWWYGIQCSGGLRLPEELNRAKRVYLSKYRIIYPLYSDDIDFKESCLNNRKEDGSSYKYRKITQVYISVDPKSLTGLDLYKQRTPRLLNDEKTDFCINGVPSMEGAEAVMQSLEPLGFIERENSYGMREARAFGLDKEKINQLTAGVFSNLTSFDLSEMECRVYLKCYQSGLIEEASIHFDFTPSLEGNDAIEVNKKLMKIFGDSKIGNKTFGYMTYYCKNIECYFPNDLSLTLRRK